MKRILSVALVATLLAASCSKTEVINPVGNQLGFSTNMSKLTKAEGTADATADGLVNLKAQDFRVWATYVADDQHVPGDQAKTFFDGIENLPITWNNPTVNQWNTAKDYYWPGKDKELKFFAVSGGDQIKAATSPVTINNDRNGLTITGFQVTPGNYDEDLMVADFVQQHQADKTVDLKFHHALTKVEFLFKTIVAEGIHVFVQDLVVKDLATVANLTVTEGTPTTNSGNENYAGTQIPVTMTWPVDLKGTVSTDDATNDFVDDWTTPYTGGNFPAKIEGAAVTNADKIAMEITSTTDPQVFTTWLMLPQVISDKQVEITYLINERRFTSIFPLSTASLTAWAQNQYVRYTVTIAPNLISFSPDVKDWDRYDADTQKSDEQDIEYQN